MQEILNDPDHQEDHRDAQGDQRQNTQERQGIVGSIPEQRGNATQHFYDPVANIAEDGENGSQQSRRHIKPPKFFNYYTAGRADVNKD